jgi:hypothetical protein
MRMRVENAITFIQLVFQMFKELFKHFGLI